jgi:hypothetical protein
MAAPTPATDPNFAWDTQGWTNQGNTGDVEGENPGGSGLGLPASSLVDPAALSGFAFRNMDPDQLTTAGATLTTNTVYFSAFTVDTPTISTKGLVDVTTHGTVTVAYYAIVDANGTTQAVTANFGGSWTSSSNVVQPEAWASTSNFYNTGLSAILIPPGYYLFGVATTNSVNPVLSGMSTRGIVVSSGQGNQAVPATASTPLQPATWPRFTSGSVTISSSFPASFTFNSSNFATASQAPFGAGF